MKNRLFILTLIYALALAACGTPATSSEATPTPYPTPVRPTYTVQRGDILVTAKFFGGVAPKPLHTVTFQMDGQIGEVFVNVNDVVKAGQVLGELSELKSMQATADEMHRTIRNAQINLEIAQLTLEKYKAENRPTYDIKIQELEVERAQLALNEVLQQLGIDPAAITSGTIDVQVEKARAVAPADGVIIFAANVGRKVAPITPAFVIGDPNQLELVASFSADNSDEQLKEMFEGMAVIAWRDATPDRKLTGTIRQLPSPFGAGPADAREVIVVLDQAPAPNTYQTGDKLTVQVELANKKNVLWLPPDAIRQGSGITFVVVTTVEGPKRIEIQVGLKTRDRVEILSGLDEGQVVVGP